MKLDCARVFARARRLSLRPRRMHRSAVMAGSSFTVALVTRTFVVRFGFHDSCTDTVVNGRSNSECGCLPRFARFFVSAWPTQP